MILLALNEIIHVFFFNKKAFFVQYWNFLSFSPFQYQNFLKTFLAQILRMCTKGQYKKLHVQLKNR